MLLLQSRNWADSHRFEEMNRFIYTDILKNIMLSYVDEETLLSAGFNPMISKAHLKVLLKLPTALEVLDWTAQSADLNSIDNSWEIVYKLEN